MQQVLYPALYQVNTRVWLAERGRALGRTAALDDFPDSFLDQLAERGFDWFWPLGVWQTGPAAQQVSRSQREWRLEYQSLLDDFCDADVSGSPFAVQEYEVDRRLGGSEAMARLRQRLKNRGIRLLLDFVPNHTAPDHRWIGEHPEYFILGNDSDLAREPRNYIRLDTHAGARVFAHGRDPYFPGWPDTAQLNYRHPGLRKAVLRELLRIAEQCDGVRCDMAMLLLPDVITRTWGDRSKPSDGSAPVDAPFWPEAIVAVHAQTQGFLFMAEVYWDLEWALQQQGFQYTYDKRHYDRVHARDPGAVRGHLSADLEFQRKSVRFLENHDEPRAASAFPHAVHGAAAVLTYLVPGMRFFHEGQFEGRRQKASLHLQRRPDEPVDPGLKQFYERLLRVVRRPELRNGRWQLLPCRQAWEENRTWSRFLAFSWEGGAKQRMLVVVNYGPTQGQCYVSLPFTDLRGKKVRLKDTLGTASYEREGDTLASTGLYLDMAEWAFHAFEWSE